MIDRKLIGWSIHGSWSADDDFLKMGKFDDSSFFINNFLPLSSNRVDYHIEFKPTFDFSKKSNEGKFPNEEVIIVGFSPYMHDGR